MNKPRLYVLIVLLVLALLLYSSSVKGEAMSVDFGSSGTGKYLDFGNLSGTGNNDQITILANIYISSDPDSPGSGYIFTQFGQPVTDGELGLGFAVEKEATYGQGLRFFCTSSSTTAVYIAEFIYSLNTWYHVSVTYDAATPVTNAKFYVDGVLLNTYLLEQDMTGTRDNATVYPARIGELYEVLYGTTYRLQFHGKIANVLMYDRVLSADEIATAAKSKLTIPSYSGLVFAPRMYGASDSRDGDTLSANNVILDIVSGASGVPYGSPPFYADSVLSISPDDMR